MGPSRGMPQRTATLGHMTPLFLGGVALVLFAFPASLACPNDSAVINTTD